MDIAGIAEREEIMAEKPAAGHVGCDSLLRAIESAGGIIQFESPVNAEGSEKGVVAKSHPKRLSPHFEGKRSRLGPCHIIPDITNVVKQYDSNRRGILLPGCKFSRILERSVTEFDIGFEIIISSLGC